MAYLSKTDSKDKPEETVEIPKKDLRKIQAALVVVSILLIASGYLIESLTGKLFAEDTGSVWYWLFHIILPSVTTIAGIYTLDRIAPLSVKE